MNLGSKDSAKWSCCRFGGFIPGVITDTITVPLKFGSPRDNTLSDLKVLLPVSLLIMEARISEKPITQVISMKAKGVRWRTMQVREHVAA